MGRQDELIKFIDLAYEGATDAERWPEFWEELMKALDASAAAVLGRSLARLEARVVSTRGSEERSELYARHYGLLDPWFLATVSQGFSSGTNVIVGDALVPRQHLRRTEFYADYARRYDLIRPLTLATPQQGDDLFVMTVVRAENTPAWSDEDVRWVSALEPHVRRSLQIHARLQRSERRAEALQDGLDRFAAGVVIVGPSGAVEFANRAALRMHEQRDGLAIAPDGLWAYEPQANATIRGAVRAAAKDTQRLAAAQPLELLIPRPSKRPAYRVSVSRIARTAVLETAAGFAALVIVHDPDSLPVAADAQLARLGLTAAEIMVALSLARGASVASIADERGVSVETIRSQLKAAMSKTGTRRQAELVKLVLSGAVAEPGE